jgi:RNA polymerase sigma-70 factor (TIGR02952 family)
MEAVQGKADHYMSAAAAHEAVMSVEEFAQVYDMYFKRVYKYICYRINNHYTAEDICSQVFEAVMCKYHSFSSEKSTFEVWLFAIVRNAVTDYFRAQKKRSYFSLDSLLDMVFPKPSPEELAIRDDNNQALFKALSTLREKERNIIAMKYAAGLRNAEIAQIMGVSESNIGVVLYRSLKKLHGALEAGGFRNE